MRKMRLLDWYRYRFTKPVKGAVKILGRGQGDSPALFPTLDYWHDFTNTFLYEREFWLKDGVLFAVSVPSEGLGWTIDGAYHQWYRFDPYASGDPTERLEPSDGDGEGRWA